mmetsp:Transcript_7474/g.9276  ORF Transcript_7474/g.9276 Transcript_7474/m.9276 type:complete len:307 (-) Transcript_7474:136-1056(-)
MASKVSPLPPRSFHSSTSTTITSLTFSRTWLAAVAKENMEIANHGSYTNRHGEQVDVSRALKEVVKGSKHYHYSKEVLPPSPKDLNSRSHDTKMYVCYSLILQAAIALRKAGAQKVGVLNSADGFVPGGKFGTGCLSLEACLCRGSLLWPCLDKFKDKPNIMYKINKEKFTDSPSSCAIYSPNVPVIRRDALEAQFLDEHEVCSFVSLPPPNAFALGSTENVRSKLREHISRALYIFAENGCTDIVLCSYGCGTRGHDPHMVAEIYNDILSKELKGFFNRVIFAINPKKKVEYNAFASIFEENNSL